MKPYTIISFVLLVALSLIPPIELVLKNPENSWWLWMIVTAGFFGIFTIFIKTNIFVRFIAIAGLINCFFSVSPYISFTSYCSLVLCCYFYICCTRIEDWSLVFKAATTIMLLNAFLMIMEFFGKDTLMDWGLSQTQNFGVIGHHMQMASLAVIIGAFLLTAGKINILFTFMAALFTKSSWSFLCSCVGFIIIMRKLRWAAILLVAIFMVIFGIWSLHTHKIQENFNDKSGRVVIWEKSFYLASKRPWLGWGIGTYKDVFFPVSRLTCVPWKTAHNFIAELSFEVGYPLTICVLFVLGYLSLILIRKKLWSLLAGLVMMFMDALVHFPDRMMQTVPLIIIFLAFCTVCLRKVRSCPSYSQN